MQVRFYEYTQALLSNTMSFDSTNVNEWTDAQITWANQWASYVSKGGDRPPFHPPHP